VVREAVQLNGWLAASPASHHGIGRCGSLRGSLQSDSPTVYGRAVEILALDGLRLAYWQQGSGQPVVFVHGVGTSGELWATTSVRLRATAG